MKYFIDTEFLEGIQKETFPINLFRKETKPTIDLISIGIVAEDGREYYAISKDFNLKEAWNRFEWKQRSKEDIEITPALGSLYKDYWIRDNVLKPIFYEWMNKDINFHHYDEHFTYKNFKMLINKYGKTNKQIAEEVKGFTLQYNWVIDGISTATNKPYTVPQFYGYYCDYDWVVFCWLFGRMIDLPKGFPMYCIDLKQELERLNETLGYNCDVKGCSYRLQEKPNYPIQTNTHNALADARWNKQLYEFLNKL